MITIILTKCDDYFQSVLHNPYRQQMSSSGLPSHFVPGFHDEAAVRKLDYQPLGETGLLISRLSFGCAQLGCGVTIDEDTNEPLTNYGEAVKAVTEAVKGGINYIDTSPFYGAGKSEIVLGHALRDIPRAAYFVATKVGRRADCQFDFSASNVIQSVNQSLRKLHVDYIDVVQVHDVEFAESPDIIVNQTLPALEQLRQSGKIKYLGVTGYSLSALKEVIEKSTVKLDLVLSYCRQTLFCRELEDYIPYFRSKNLGIINAAVHGMALLTPNPIPDWHPVNAEVRSACSRAIEWTKANGIDIARLALGDALSFSGVDTILVGNGNTQVLKANMDVLTNGLSDKEEEALDYVKRNFMDGITKRNWEGVELEKLAKDHEGYITFLRELHAS